MAIRALAAAMIGLAFILSTSATGQQFNCDPGPNEAAFFVDSSFRGDCETVGIGDYATTSSLGTGLANDAISSIKVGSAVQVFACQHRSFDGRCELFTGSDANLGNNPIGHDRISSVKVQRRGSATSCVPGATQAAFFKDSNFSGACVVRDIGNYPRSVDIGLTNDSISSVRLGSAVQALLCRDGFYRGRCELLTANDTNLGDNPIGHDRISSVKVQRQGASATCLPTADQVAFFQHISFGGACEVRGIGDYGSALQIGLGNDVVSSIRVGANVQAVLCRDTGFGGNCQLFVGNDGNLGDNAIGNDAVSSARVQPRGQQDCRPQRNQVAVFRHSNFLAPCIVKDVGNYSNSSQIGLANDSISSVLVGGDMQAVLCRDSGFGGNCELFVGNDSALGNNAIGHDSVSSMKVQARGSSECLPGSQEVGFFEHNDFIAPCVVKPVGNYATAAEIGLRDNSISSIRVGSAVQACACSSENFGTRCDTYTANAGTLPAQAGDSISSARIQPRGATCQPQDTPPAGVSGIDVVNCHSQMRRVHLWTRDLTAGGSFSQRGSLDAQYSNGSCPAAAAPFAISLENGHSHQFVAVDPDAIGCGGQNDPQVIACQKFTFTQPIVGNTNGTRLRVLIN